MISKKDILNMARHVTRHSNGHQRTKLIHPRREWFIGLIVFLLVVVSGGVLNAERHRYYSDLESAVETQDVSVKEYRAERVATAIAQYTDTEATYTRRTQAILTSPVATTSMPAAESVETDSTTETRSSAPLEFE